MPDLNNLQVLQCAGGHEWTRLKKRGRKPTICPEYPKCTEPPEPPPELPKAKKAPGQAMQEGRQKKALEERRAKIQEIINNYGECDCGLYPEMTDEELYFLKGCQDRYACPALVRVREAVGLHAIDTTQFWINRRNREKAKK